ncbi:hypothetical protein DXG01_015959, partial [Tephrocybe rancida]
QLFMPAITVFTDASMCHHLQQHLLIPASVSATSAAEAGTCHYSPPPHVKKSASAGTFSSGADTLWQHLLFSTSVATAPGSTCQYLAPPVK